MFSSLPQDLRDGERIKVFPVMFSQGINEQQTFANTMGTCTLQEGINKENYLLLEKYWNRHKVYYAQKGEPSVCSIILKCLCLCVVFSFFRFALLCFALLFFLFIFCMFCVLMKERYWCGEDAKGIGAHWKDHSVLKKGEERCYFGQDSWFLSFSEWRKSYCLQEC